MPLFDCQVTPLTLTVKMKYVTNDWQWVSLTTGCAMLSHGLDRARERCVYFALIAQNSDMILIYHFASAQVFVQQYLKQGDPHFDV